MREIKFRVWNKKENPTKRKGKGFYKQHGYVLQYAPYHPYNNARGYVMEHRLMMENLLGRYLKPKKELVHHINGIRHDNRLINLKLSNPKDHAKGHVGSRNQNGQFVCKSKEFKIKKFRLYDSDRGIMQIYDLNELISKTYRRGNFEYRGEWTGLKDKNGVDIYEGDLDQDYNVIEWCENRNGWAAKIYDIVQCEVIECNCYECAGNFELNDYIKDIEIIGNIHESKPSSTILFDEDMK